jgi:hypothetical protein
MTRDEIVTALRCCEQHNKCEGACPLTAEFGCIEKAMGYAADLIENQQRHIEALLQANAALRDTVLRRDEQIEKLAADRKALINELCQYCGKYKHAHEGACDGCKWREM